MKQTIEAAFRPEGHPYIYVNDEDHIVEPGDIVQASTPAGNIRHLHVTSSRPFDPAEDFGFDPKPCYLFQKAPK